MFSARSTFIAAALLALPFAGCSSTSSATTEHFLAGLSAHFVDHPSCLFPDAPSFPIETTDPARTKQLNALVEAKMLDVAVEHDIHASRYTTTEMGVRYAPRFCYGHRTATTIDSFTPPAPHNGFPETQVVYHYKIQDVPVWARSEAMRQAFPAMAVETSGTASDKATLAGTIAGWQVPD